ncbi:hypothetical protein [Leisingera sp. M658]|uniref:hypothetical protein n=1 Tax=Leisingera sp. M658 TaxID=2867015 RepID=UPI0021A41848|nr:hypothetical protein [Leisingera sp. M658]UWQ77354.1 hypothetical protein K3724_22730 [Leisingera sp. M658]
MANSVINITLGGASYGMRPEYEAQRGIEGRVNLTIAELLECAKFERLTLEEAGVIVWHGCKANGEDFDIEAVAKRIFEERMSNLKLRLSICEFLATLLYAPEEVTKKFEAEVRPLLESQANI